MEELRVEMKVSGPHYTEIKEQWKSAVIKQHGLKWRGLMAEGSWRGAAIEITPKWSFNEAGEKIDGTITFHGKRELVEMMVEESREYLQPSLLPSTTPTDVEQPVGQTTTTILSSEDKIQELLKAWSKLWEPNWEELRREKAPVTYLMFEQRRWDEKRKEKEHELRMAFDQGYRLAHKEVKREEDKKKKVFGSHKRIEEDEEVEEEEVVVEKVEKKKETVLSDFLVGV